VKPQAGEAFPVAVHRVACHARSRRAAQLLDLADRRDFKPGEQVCSLRRVKNDGLYPHKDIGEVLVREGDVGIVRERWSFLGEVYYAVEFVAGAVVVIMRGREMQRVVAFRGGQTFAGGRS
jgi:nitrogen fixation protein NifZ